MLTVIPAIDVVGGRAVRPRAGRLVDDRAYGDPLDLAAAFVAQGARWLHVADLDRAYGRGDNLAHVGALVAAAHAAGVRVQVSGGIADPLALEATLGTGADRVHLATQVLADPAWVTDVLHRGGERIAVCLDCRGDRLIPRGAHQDLGLWRRALDILDASGCRRYVVTDVDRDGALAGPPLDLVSHVRAATRTSLTAGGGVSGAADLRALRDLADEAGPGTGQPDAVIVGRALYVGALTLREAHAAAGAGESAP